jgi:hypothetical protein
MLEDSLSDRTGTILGVRVLFRVDILLN